MDMLIEVRWAVYLGFAVAVVFFVWGYVEGYWSAEDRIRRENWGIYDNEEE